MIEKYGLNEILCWTPNAISQHNWLMFCPNDRTFTTILRPNASRPIANGEKVFQETRISGDRIHWTQVC